MDSTARLYWLTTLFADIQDGKVKANYSNDVNMPGKPMSSQEFVALISRVDSMFTEDAVEFALVVQESRIQPRDMQSVIFQEKWVMYPQEGLVRRVLGFAACEDVYGDDGELRGFRPLLWVMTP